MYRIYKTATDPDNTEGFFLSLTEIVEAINASGHKIVSSHFIESNFQWVVLVEEPKLKESYEGFAEFE